MCFIDKSMLDRQKQNHVLIYCSISTNVFVIKKIEVKDVKNTYL